MLSSFYRHGKLAALSKLGAKPEFGDDTYSNWSPSITGVSGRLMQPVSVDPRKQVSTAFDENFRQLQYDPANMSSTMPVGAAQSKVAKETCIVIDQQFNNKKIATNSLQGRTKFRGLDISIENRKGSVREWFDPHNHTKGETKMLYPYGYIRRTEGMDGDHVDCYIGPDEDAKYVYIVTTKKAPDFKEDDEQKCMLGFTSENTARKCFFAHYDNPRFFGSLKTMTFEEFKKSVLNTRHTEDKKVAELDPRLYDTKSLIAPGMGNSFEGSVPGDRLGLPMSSLVGLRTIPGSAMGPQDTVDRSFRFMDQSQDTTALDGGGQMPTGPEI